MAFKNCAPTAQEIATAIVAAERNIEPHVQAWVDEGNMLSLTDATGNPWPAGTMGEIVSIEDTGTGLVRWSIDGTDPVGGDSREFVTNGPYHAAYNVKNVDLSLVRLNGSSAASDFSIIYHRYL